jgi:hypothetical protein
MKTFNSFSWLSATLVICVCSVLFAFTTLPGAHSMKVYLDSKLMLDKYIDSRTDVAKLTLDPSEKHNNLVIQYSECGRTVTGRKLTLKDDDNKVLKDWKFEGSTKGFEDSMECSVKDIVALRAKGSNTLKLFYSSNEFPDGHQILSLTIAGSATTAAR